MFEVLSLILQNKISSMFAKRWWGVAGTWFFSGRGEIEVHGAEVVVSEQPRKQPPPSVGVSLPVPFTRKAAKEKPRNDE